MPSSATPSPLLPNTAACGRRIAATSSVPTATADITAAAGWGLTRHRTDQAPETALMAIYMALSDGGRR